MSSLKDLEKESHQLNSFLFINLSDQLTCLSIGNLNHASAHRLQKITSVMPIERSYLFMTIYVDDRSHPRTDGAFLIYTYLVD